MDVYMCNSAGFTVLRSTKSNRLGAAMRGAMAGDVAAERQLNAIERLLALMGDTVRPLGARVAGSKVGTRAAA